MSKRGGFNRLPFAYYKYTWYKSAKGGLEMKKSSLIKYLGLLTSVQDIGIPCFYSKQ